MRIIKLFYILYVKCIFNFQVGDLYEKIKDIVRVMECYKKGYVFRRGIVYFCIELNFLLFFRFILF